ncbi:MAG: PadR family transcriptional regulator [Ilumatobacteraceae bacterium]
MAVREGLLSLLEDGPRYGYQLKTEFEQATGGVWPLNVGQVYTTLDRLERDGMVSVGGAAPGAPLAPGHKIYAITMAGKDELGSWWEAVPADEPPPRDELMLKVLMAIEHGRAHALKVVTRQRTVLVQLLQAKRRERSEVADGSLAARLVTEALVARAEADLRWLDTVEAHLAKKGN